MIPAHWLRGEIAVLGLGKSGVAVSTLLARAGGRVYASDAGESASVAAAAAALRRLGVDAEAGGHDLQRIGRAGLAIVSPGIPPDAPAVRAACDRGVAVVGEVEVGLRFLPTCRYVAITGTNGKSTATAIAAHLLQALGHDAVAAGNIGVPVSEVALRERAPAWVALEVSSFQLHDTPALAPTVGVLTNLAPDHLDRYASVEEYYADKALLFRNARPTSVWVHNADDPEVARLAGGKPGRHYRFSVAGTAVEATWSPDDAELSLWGEPLLRRDELPLIGSHNVANALAAALAVSAGDPAHRGPDARRRIADGLRTVRGLPHRLEVVGEAGGVLWINDSKATNVSSAKVAIEGMTRPTIVLLGGKHKGEPYSVLTGPLRAVARHVIAYGEAADTIVEDLGDTVPVVRMRASFAEVMDRARALAQPGDAVLLSPACASFDMFDNYEHRGAEFRRLALQVPATSGASDDGEESR